MTGEKLTRDELKSYFNQHGVHPDNSNLEQIMRRYHHFGNAIFKVYRGKLRHIYCKTHLWFLLEMATPIASKSASINRVFGYMLKDEHTDWERIYSYYDAVGHDEFGIVSDYFEKYRDQLLGRNYDMI